MCESGLGMETPATRQKAGRLLKTCAFGAVKEPAGTSWATLMVACGSAIPVRLPQEAALGWSRSDSDGGKASDKEHETSHSEYLPRR